MTAPAISPNSFSTFGELLRYLRKRAELSQRELAGQVGYHYSSMSRIENNEYIPDPAVLMSRFVPALGLEKEPAWTKRLLELANVSGEGSGTSSASNEPTVDSSPIELDTPLNLFPVSLTSLLGREQDVASLNDLLSQKNVRLITLIGPPGVGKTRLSVQVATESAGMFVHGLQFIDLAPITDPNGFLPALAQHLGVNEIADTPLITRMAQALRQKNILLVLDNFEQLIEAAPQVYQLLSTTQHVKALVTSRVPLHIVGENQYIVQPLSLPQRETAANQNLMRFAAIRLFVERARAIDSHFELTPENSEAVIELCRRLDGLPLAIELTAARIRTFSPQVMLKEFEHRFEWLAPNYREEQSAKQTLRGAIEWSYNLLSEKEQILLRRLSVFSGGRTVETVKAICTDGDSLKEEEIFDLLIQLTDKSLLYTEPNNEEPRFSFLETIHEYAREKLKQADEEITIRNRHLAYFCDMAERFELGIESENQTSWLDRVEREHNNLRAALGWSLQEGADLQIGIRLAASLGLFWYLHSHFVEGLERSKLFLEKARTFPENATLAKLLFRTADLYLHQAEFEPAVQLCDEAIEVSRRLNDKALLAWALYVRGDIHLALHELNDAERSLSECIEICIEIGYAGVQDIALLLLSTILLRQGEVERATTTVKEGLALAEKLSDPWSVASGLSIIGEIHLKQKAYDEARTNFEKSLDASRMVGDKIIIGNALVNLAVLTNLQEQYEESDHYAEEALSIFQLIGDETQQAYPMRIMGYAAIHEDNLIRAQVLMRESLTTNNNLHNTRGQLSCLVGMAHLALAEKDMQQAVMLCALAESHGREKSLKFPEPDQVMLEAVLGQCKKKMGKAKYESAYQQGASLPLEETIQRLIHS